jgi:hypothetical protein
MNIVVPVTGTTRFGIFREKIAENIKPVPPGYKK